MKYILFCLLLFSFTSLAATNVRLYRPFEQNVANQVTPIVVEKIQGECHEHSLLDHRSDAWRCQAEGQVLDPCFIKTYVKPEVAVCPLSPWQSQATAVDLKMQAELPWNKNNTNVLDMSQDYPWAIELMSGAHCIRISHASFSIQGQSVEYACDNHGFLLGQIQRCELIWKMLFVPSLKSDVLNTTEIATAWF